MIGKRFRSLPFIFANDNYTLRQGIADMIQGVESSPFLLAGIGVLHDHSVGLNAFGCSISRPDMSQSNCCQVSCFTSN